ncbi:hypothetical protein [Hugenholtzia roseola]|uniref:hypothetical protein n=1 Tax=Hugenholtzia roseola TaxID=1002 RepID=UPI00041C9951|nr:hypothetical protein [Hugenholtzia roseola]
MKVTGFSFIRNGLKFDYPFVEAIRSVLPLCDDFVLAVGKSEDDTLKIAAQIDPKIKIIETVWDETLRTGGRVLADETNKAFQAIGQDADWCIYIQGDEALHQQDFDTIRREMKAHLDNPKIEGFLLNYLHFYGSYDYVAESTAWYRREIRIVRNNKNIFSFRDAQGFRMTPDRKLNVRHIDACVHHYGWVREPAALRGKQKACDTIFHGDKVEAKMEDIVVSVADEFDYSQIDALRRFEGTHPAAIAPRIAAMNWKFDHDISKNKLSLKDKFRFFMDKYFGFRPFEYKNYTIVSSYLND